MSAVLRSVFLRGLPVSVIGLAASARLLTAFDLPAGAVPVLAALPVLLGCLTAGFAAGRQNRKHGWQTGFSAALLLVLIFTVPAWLLCGKLCIPHVLIPALPAGMTGAVLGVNQPAPLPHGHSRLCAGAGVRLAFLPLRLRRCRNVQNPHNSAVKAGTP